MTELAHQLAHHEPPGYSDRSMPVLFAAERRRALPSSWAQMCLDLAGHRHARHDVDFWTLLGRAMLTAEVFDFGLVDDVHLKHEATRGGALWEHGFLRTPYESVIFYYDLKLAPGVEGGDFWPEGTLASYATLVSVADVTDCKGAGLMAADFVIIPQHQRQRYGNQIAGERWPYLLTCAGVVVPDDNAEETWSGYVVANALQFDDDRAADAAAMSSLGDGVLGLSMVCATKNIPMDIEPVPTKLNAKRAKSGKPPLVRVTHVNAGRYFEALSNTAHGGTHASPVPHLRRGHIRHLASGQNVWIKDMLVNCRSRDELSKTRDHYEVQP